MLVYLLILLVLCASGLRVAKKNEFFSDYLSKEQTTAINGIFVLLVFLSHAVTYLELSGPLDDAYLTLKGYLRQLIVASFLFYSGYGMLESIQKKGMAYVKSIPGKRFSKVLLHMEIAVALFLLTDLAIGKHYGLKTTLLAFTFWESIGNSNWYIFAILCLYLIVFVSFLACRANKWVGTVLTTVLSLVFAFWMIRAGKDTWWYNTVILYPAGMWWSLLKPQIDKLLMKNDVVWFLTVGAVLVPYVLCYTRRDTHLVWYYLWGVLFMALLVLLTMKVKLGNDILQWFGSHVFSIYILQRIPMMVFTKLGMTDHRYSFITLSLIATLVLAVLFDTLLEKLDGAIWGRGKAPLPAPEGKVETT